MGFKKSEGNELLGISTPIGNYISKQIIIIVKAYKINFSFFIFNYSIKNIYYLYNVLHCRLTSD